MNRYGKQVVAGLAGAIGVVVAAAVMAPQHGSETMEPRTPIDVAALGPQVGERVPAFRLPDQNGNVRTLETVLGPNGGILLFHRSADW